MHDEQQARLMECANAVVEAEAAITEITGVPPVSKIQPTPATESNNFAQHMLVFGMEGEDAIGLAQDLEDGEPARMDASATDRRDLRCQALATTVI